MDIEIAPNFTCSDWDALKPKLDAGGSWAACPHEWSRAITVVESRIQRRFLDLIQKLDASTYAGFAILALDCLLLETIEAFRNGARARNSTASRNTVVSLLTTSLRFKSEFTPKISNDFYTNVRNGLLHDGETRKGWLVSINPKYSMIAPQSGGFFVVNRRKFHAALAVEFKEYIESLRDPAETTRRQNLIKALDDLCARSRP